MPSARTIDGRVPLERPITYSDEIELSYRDNVFTLEFAALHYSAPGKNSYLYRMAGFSDAWIAVGADRRFATFTGLAAGEYLFSVRGANSDGVWNDHGASLRIIVTPPFWATWWFRLLAAGLLAALALVVIQSRMRGVRMKTELVAAHDAQMAIMPQTTPRSPGFDISGVCVPAHEVGGDFFDYFWLEGEPRRLGVVVGDVAGKAMSAAMNAVMSDGMVFSRARQAGSVEEIMCSLNRSIHDKVGDADVHRPVPGGARTRDPQPDLCQRRALRTAPQIRRLHRVPEFSRATGSRSGRFATPPMRAGP